MVVTDQDVEDTAEDTDTDDTETDSEDVVPV